MPEVSEKVTGRPDHDCLARVEISIRGDDGETNLAVLEDLVEATSTVIEDYREERIETDGGQVEASRRTRVAITTAEPYDRHARVTTTERLERLLEALELWGPEPEGIVVDVDRAALDELPPAWETEYLTTASPIGRCDECGRSEVLDDIQPVIDVDGVDVEHLCRRCR